MILGPPRPCTVLTECSNVIVTLVIHSEDMRYQQQLVCNYYVPGTVLSAYLQPYSVLQ